MKLIHRDCQKPAFQWLGKEIPSMHEKVDINLFMHMDGRPVERFDLVRCDSCHNPVSPFELRGMIVEAIKNP